MAGGVRGALGSIGHGTKKLEQKMLSGALGAAGAELMAEALSEVIPQPKNLSTQEQAQYQHQVKEISKLTTALGGLALGLSIPDALAAAEIALDNNFSLPITGLHPNPPTIAELAAQLEMAGVRPENREALAQFLRSAPLLVPLAALLGGEGLAAIGGYQAARALIAKAMIPTIMLLEQDPKWQSLRQDFFIAMGHWTETRPDVLEKTYDAGRMVGTLGASTIADKVGGAIKKGVQKFSDNNNNEFNRKTENLDGKTEAGPRHIKNPHKAESPIWKSLKPYKNNVKTNGARGAKARYYKWDKLHNDIEVYSNKGRTHLGTMDPVTGKMIKPPVAGREIQKEI